VGLAVLGQAPDVTPVLGAKNPVEGLVLTHQQREQVFGEVEDLSLREIVEDGWLQNIGAVRGKPAIAELKAGVRRNGGHSDCGASVAAEQFVHRRAAMIPVVNIKVIVFGTTHDWWRHRASRLHTRKPFGYGARICAAVGAFDTAERNGSEL
jgi:hypothetical protein